MPKVTTPLTDREIKNAKPGDKPVTLFDGGGLYLEIATTGAKSWRFSYTRPSGGRNRIGLGTYPAVSLDGARQERFKLREMVRAGQDPGEVRKLSRQNGTAAPASVLAANSFEAIAREWHRVYAANKVGDTTAEQNLRRLELNVFPDLGSTDVANITPMMVIDVIKKIEERGATEMSNRVCGLMAKVFSHAMATGRLTTGNPAVGLETALKSHEGGHMAALRVAELPAFFAALADYERRPTVAPQTIALLRVMLLTLGRTAELIETPWSEIDLDAERWVIPWQRMKMGKRKIKPRRIDHRMFLPPAGWTMLRQLHQVTGRHHYVFPSPRKNDGTKHISNNAVLSALAAMGYQHRMTGHGFRSLGKGVLKLLGYDDGGGIVRGLIERALAHKSKEAHGESYDRELFLRERRDMMLDFAGYMAAVERGQSTYQGKIRLVEIGVDAMNGDDLDRDSDEDDEL